MESTVSLVSCGDKGQNRGRMEPQILQCSLRILMGLSFHAVGHHCPDQKPPSPMFIDVLSPSQNRPFSDQRSAKFARCKRPWHGFHARCWQPYLYTSADFKSAAQIPFSDRARTRDVRRTSRFCSFGSRSLTCETRSF